MPMPSSALPASDMIVRTSAKSRLIRPGSVTRSEMPCTPWRSTSSATRNASTIDVCLSSTDSSRLFGTTISVSTSSASAWMPLSASSRRREPSKPNGLVTMPTVSAPSSRAMRATIGAGARAGAAAGAGGDEDHVAALEQRLDLVVLLHRGLAAEVGVGAGAEAARDPAPPMWSVMSAVDCCSDCRSVLTARNSTPSTSASTMRLTALTPAPPTPTTRMTGLADGHRATPNADGRPTRA